jgi:hypothetical protein
MSPSSVIRLHESPLSSAASFPSNELLSCSIINSQMYKQIECNLDSTSFKAQKKRIIKLKTKNIDERICEEKYTSVIKNKK